MNFMLCFFALLLALALHSKGTWLSSCVRTFLIILLCEYGVLCVLNIVFNVITLVRHF